MKRKLLEHAFSVVLITVVLVGAVAGIGWYERNARASEKEKTEVFGELAFVNFNDPFDRALLEDVANVYYPGQHDRNETALAEIASSHEQALAKKLTSSHESERLNIAKAGELLGMYLSFLIVYAVVIALTYYGVHTIGVWRFCLKRRELEQTQLSFFQKVLRLGRSTLGVAATFVLFSPAYVIAYALKTRLNTDTSLFMAVLALVSNGLLIVYSNKFYAFLTSESRKGYVETAYVKNLNHSYDPHASDGIPYRWIFRMRKRFDGHVFDHIYRNASFQYLPTLKEQASFLITGLIIIEMALNIHGHLSYEMLRQLLYKNYDIVIATILLVFYTVKATEVFSDVMSHRIAVGYENTDS